MTHTTITWSIALLYSEPPIHSLSCTHLLCCQVADRLFSSFGQDILDALYWTATEPKEKKRAHIGVIPHFLMAVLYVCILAERRVYACICPHACMLFSQCICNSKLVVYLLRFRLLVRKQKQLKHFDLPSLLIQ